MRSRSAAVGVLVLLVCVGTASRAAAPDDVKELVRALRSKFVQDRIDAARTLAALGPAAERASEALVKALSDAHPEVREQARVALSAIGPGALEDLLEEARSDDDAIRAVVTGLLVGIEPGVETIDAAQLGDALRALDREDPDLREVLGRLLRKTPPKYAERLFRAARWSDDAVYELVAQACGALGPSALPVIAEELGSTSDNRARLAILALGYLGEHAHAQVPALRKIAQGGPADRRGLALLSLARLGADPETLVPLLRTALDDPDESVARRARQAFVALGEPAMEAVIGMLFEDGGRLRETAEELLAAAGDAGRMAIERALPDAAVERRPALVRALVRSGVEGASDATEALLARWLDKGSVAERRDLVRALRPHRRGGRLLAIRAVAGQVLVANADLRADAIRTLGVALPKDVEVFGSLFEDPSPRVRIEAAGACATGRVLITEALCVVETAAAGDDEALRIRAAEILADLGKRSLEAHTTLEKLVRDPDPGVRMAALHAVADIFQDPIPISLDRVARIAALDASVANAVAHGCEWLARHQDRVAEGGNGGWNADGFAKHDGVPGPQPGRGAYDVGVSALALLALVSAGQSEWGDADRTRFAPNLREGFSYLLRSQDEHGCIGSLQNPAGVLPHGVATLALAEGWLVTRNPAYRAPLEAAVRYIEWARNPYLAWRYVPRNGENDTHVTCWMVMALDAARRGGIQIDPDAIEGARQWVHKLTDSEFGQTGYNIPGGTSSSPSGSPDSPSICSARYPFAEKRRGPTAAGVWMRLAAFGESGQSQEVRLGADLMVEIQPAWGVPWTDQWTWWTTTRALHLLGGTHWRQWFPVVRAVLVDNQEAAGPNRGSWAPVGVWGAEGGRVYSTAMAVLTLAAPADDTPAEDGQAVPATFHDLEIATRASLQDEDRTLAAAAREALQRLHENGR